MIQGQLFADLRPRGQRRLPRRHKLGALALHAPLMIVGEGDDRRIVVDAPRALAILQDKYGHLPGRLVAYYLDQANRWLDENGVRQAMVDALLDPSANGGWTVCVM